MRCTDSEIVKSIITDESVWQYTIDDNVPDSLKEKAADIFLSDSRIYVLHPGEGIILICIPLNSIMLDGHVCIVKSARGRDAFRKVRAAIAWIFENTQYRKIIGWIPEFNKAMLMFAVNIGMKIEGTVEKSFLRYGILHDQTIVGISKEN